jgi:AcrR family transcriptional regulator
MDAIAEASGVSKATIYNHWPDKDALCLEVLAYVHGLDRAPPIFDSGDFRADLIAQLRYEPGADRKAMKDRIWPHLVAYAARNHAFGKVWRAKAIEPAQVVFTALMKRGEKNGILKPGIDPETGIALLIGPMMYRRIFAPRLGGESPGSFEAKVADAFLSAFGTAKAAKPAAKKK